MSILEPVQMHSLRQSSKELQFIQTNGAVRGYWHEATMEKVGTSTMETGTCSVFQKMSALWSLQTVQKHHL